MRNEVKALLQQHAGTKLVKDGMNMALGIIDYETMKIHDEFHKDMIGSVIEDMKIGDDEVLVRSLQNISDYFKNKY